MLVPFFLILVGGGMAVHCSLAARREWRAGVSTGIRSHARSEEPLAFWTIIVADVLAALLGLAFACAGIIGLFGQ